jgi:diguanylate cyclase (GGDEF)-like protein/PAS domain S-box-containing protein
MKIGGLPWRSLKARVTLSTIAILVLSIWSLAFYVSKAMRNDMQRLLGEQQRATVNLVTATVNSDFRLRMDALQNIARTINPGLVGEPVALQKLIEQRPLLQILFNAGVFVTQGDGVAIAEYPFLGRPGLNYMDRDHIAAALTHGKASVGKPVVGKRVQATSFAITTPIFDSHGTVIGAISGATDMSKANFLDDLNQSKYGVSGGYLVVDPKSRQFVVATANNKKLLMQPIPAPGVNPVLDRRLDGFDGAEVNVNSQGIEVLTSSARIPMAGWFVIATLPTQEAFAPIRNMLERTAIATGLLTLVAAALAWWMLKRQLSTMVTTIQTLSDLSKSSAYLHPLRVTTNDEIGDLLTSFNKLIAILQDRDSALHQSEERFRQFFEKNTSVQLLIEPISGAIEDANEAALRYYGYSREQLAGMRISDINILSAKRIAEERLLALHQSRNFFQFQHRLASGELRDVEVHSTPIESNGRALLLSIVHDVTERKIAEERLAQSESKLKGILEGAADAIFIANPTGHYQYVNKQASLLLGFSHDEFMAMSLMDITPPEDLDATVQQFQDAMMRGGLLTELRLKRKDGIVIPVEINASLLPDGNMYGACRDITLRKQLEENIRQLAFHDTLTKLPNRRLLSDRLEQTLMTIKRSGRFAAVMFIDLDNFKPLNDRHGHEVGDMLLIEVANRLKACVREMDTVARMGGDEFVVMLGELDLAFAASKVQAVAIAEKVRMALAQTYQLTVQHTGHLAIEVKHHCTASIGVVVFGADDGSQEDILKWADAAMYAAKDAGRNVVKLYDHRAEVSAS